MSFLSSLQLAHNNFQGNIPESIGKISSLQVLNLKGNNLSGIVPPTIYTNCSLTYLSLSNNQLFGRIPSDIGYTLPNITELILGGNHFDGPIPASLGNASNLQNLDLRKNSLTGGIPSLGLLRKLKILDVGTNMLKSGDWTFLSSLTNCTQLQILCLDFNGLGGIIPRSIGDLSSTLEVLLLSEDQLTGDIPSEIGKLKGLTVLVMQKKSLTGHIPDTLGNLPNMSLLSLSNNKLSGEIPHSIGKLERLTEIYFMENNLTGQMPASLKGCKNLLLLNLSSNSFIGSIPWEILSISTLSKGLDLSYNQLSGNIPSQIGHLMNLNSLSISNNQLSGEIPSALGECLLLESLHLEKNFLQGKIPGSLSALRGIYEMDLSQNNLSGTIPEFFESFTSIYILNLSFNELEGPVPKGGVFANSTAISIQGNKKLCARSPMQQVPLCGALPSKTKKTSYVLTIVVPLTIVGFITSACLGFILLKKNREYGTGSKISTAGDVYSYGIILLQMMTGKQPTDDMFKDGTNLHGFVEEALQQNFGDILEPSLTKYDEGGESLTTVKITWLVKQLAKLGLKCSETSPKDRPTIKDVHVEIISIEEMFSSLHH
ncbi:hypothetical protein QYE76_008509 [Lolium multiflorum]|uniref:non-specific serine/threonine protein kinase n=1 Tax=Lolium multiflorum TaxID=4521 RepID=A0AAD8TTE5_LOLMU|nr:hypothetical protein QYE76_008509 [Lolium multiflorum]